MYHAHLALRDEPFGVSQDSRFFFASGRWLIFCSRSLGDSLIAHLRNPISRPTSGQTQLAV